MNTDEWDNGRNGTRLRPLSVFIRVHRWFQPAVAPHPMGATFTLTTIFLTWPVRA